jgi:hypothetical protein
VSQVPRVGQVRYRKADCLKASDHLDSAVRVIALKQDADSFQTLPWGTQSRIAAVFRVAVTELMRENLQRATAEIPGAKTGAKTVGKGVDLPAGNFQDWGRMQFRSGDSACFSGHMTQCTVCAADLGRTE